jgi:hypothetical protein
MEVPLYEVPLYRDLSIGKLPMLMRLIKVETGLMIHRRIKMIEVRLGCLKDGYAVIVFKNGRKIKRKGGCVKGLSERDALLRIYYMCVHARLDNGFHPLGTLPKGFTFTGLHPSVLCSRLSKGDLEKLNKAARIRLEQRNMELSELSAREILDMTERAIVKIGLSMKEEKFREPKQKKSYSGLAKAFTHSSYMKEFHLRRAHRKPSKDNKIFSGSLVNVESVILKALELKDEEAIANIRKAGYALQEYNRWIFDNNKDRCDIDIVQPIKDIIYDELCGINKSIF